MDRHCCPRPFLRLTASSSTLVPQRRQPERPECKPRLTCASEAPTGRAPAQTSLQRHQAAGGQRSPGPGPTWPPENRPVGGPSRGLRGQARRLTHHPGPPLDKAATNLKAKKKKKEKKCTERKTENTDQSRVKGRNSTFYLRFTEKVTTFPLGDIPKLTKSGLRK